jgi:isopentenyl-diphosphate delta-isomerase
MQDQEQVVLVNDNNEVIGTAPKLDTHNAVTPLHRGFSLFLFNPKGELLLQQRSKLKKTFPLVWSNSCCGHPKLNESNVDAAKRHLEHELGIKDVEITEVITNYRYKVEMNGIYENEICPILVCFTDQLPFANSDEVENIRWIPWNEFLDNVKSGKSKYSLWAKEEAVLLSKNGQFLKILNENTR